MYSAENRRRVKTEKQPAITLPPAVTATGTTPTACDTASAAEKPSGYPTRSVQHPKLQFGQIFRRTVPVTPVSLQYKLCER
jgi:hypothetical protein